MPVRRRPHDRHRDFRARLRAEAPAHTATGRNQDRHLMMLSPLINGRPDTRYSCWFTAGGRQTRISSLDWTATPPSILRAKPSASTAALQPQHAQTRGEIPITPAATSARNPPRFRALALFGRRPPERGRVSSFRRPKTYTKAEVGKEKEAPAKLGRSSQITMLYIDWMLSHCTNAISLGLHALVKNGSSGL
jgi:hypothetical protein